MGEVKTTILTHIYNEEQLLPLWLEHHSKYFDRGIVVDFASTDNSRKIISKYPKFEIYDSTIEMFDAARLDKMMIEFEKEVKGTRIVLNTTEFLLGNPKKAKRDLFIPSVSLLNMETDLPFDWSKQFFEQRKYGISFENYFQYRRSRILAQNLPNYPIGRHFEHVDSDDFIIVHVGECLVNQKMIDRKLQIQHKIPDSDKDQGLGRQHYMVVNKGRRRRRETIMTEIDIIAIQNTLKSQAVDVSHHIERALTIQ